MTRLIIWGTGELGSRVGRLWRQADGPVIGLTQTGRRHEALRAAGIEPGLGNPRDLLRPNDVLLFSLPAHTTQREAVESLSGLMPPARAIFVSTTGYYGAPASVVNEQTPSGEDKRATSIAAAEQVFHTWSGENGLILRLGGLYSPDRGPFAALRRKGQARFGPPNKALPLIHYDDAAAAIVAALRHPRPQPLYLAITPPCPTRQEFYTAACDHLGLTPPTFDDPLLHSPATFDVTLLRHDLLPIPAHPNWRDVFQL